MNLTRQQISLLAIFALFLAPVLLVLMMRSSWWQYRPAELKNLGHLVQPPAQLPPATLRHSGRVDLEISGKWWLLYVLPGICDSECTDDLISLRQIHKAAGRQGQHLSIVILNENKADFRLQSSLESIYQELYFIADPPVETLAVLARVNAELTAPKGQSNEIRTYIIDPMLNVVLAYRTDANPNDINKDLKRVLKWSKQDKAP